MVDMLRFLRLFHRFRDLEQEVEERKRNVRLLQETLRSREETIRELGKDKASLQDRLIETQEEVQRLNARLDESRKDCLETLKTLVHPKPEVTGEPIRPVQSRTHVYRKRAEENRRFSQQLREKLADGAEIIA